jgi:uncharacterized membrane protein
MTIKVLLFTTVLLYSCIVSQSISYIISLQDVQQNMEARAFILFRQRTDKNFRSKFSIITWGVLCCNVLLAGVCGCYNNAFLTVCACLSLLALVADSLLAVKGNQPINRIINTWTPEKHPPNWTDYRDDWLMIFRLRWCINLGGFICLVAGLVFG